MWAAIDVHTCKRRSKRFFSALRVVVIVILSLFIFLPMSLSSARLVFSASSARASSWPGARVPSTNVSGRHSLASVAQLDTNLLARIAVKPCAIDANSVE